MTILVPPSNTCLKYMVIWHVLNKVFKEILLQFHWCQSFHLTKSFKTYHNIFLGFGCKTCGKKPFKTYHNIFNFKSPPLIVFLPHVLYVNPKWTKWSIPRLVGIRDWNHYEMGWVHGSGVIWPILFGQIHLKSTKNCQITILFGDWIETDGSDYLW